jgi:hypothetical protein
LLVLVGPRFVGALWWFFGPALWQTAFTSWIWPLLGLIFPPWTTLMYLLVFTGGVTGFEWVFMGMAVFSDVALYAGSAYGNRDRIPGYN